VGFISNLPTQLVAAFRATLEEVCAADIILHVRDVAHPNTEHQAFEVEKILKELDLEQALHDGTIINVYNKTDLLSSLQGQQIHNACRRETTNVAISAITGEGLDRLLMLIDHQLNRHNLFVMVDLPVTEGEALAWFYRRGAIQSRRDEEQYIHLKLKISHEDISRFQEQFPHLNLKYN